MYYINIYVLEKISNYNRLIYSFKSEETKKAIIGKLGLYFEFLGYKKNEILDRNLDFKVRCEQIYKRAAEDPDWIEEKTLEYFMCLKQRCEKPKTSNEHLTASTIKTRKTAIKNFLKHVKNVNVDWELINSGIPKPARFARDRGYTMEEIRKLADYPDKRMKVIVYLMATTGIRIGAFDYLKVGHIIPQYDQDQNHVASLVRVYADTEEEYPALTTLETHNEIQKWLDIRRNAGEIITNDSWLMIQLWNSETGLKDVDTTKRKLSGAGGVKKLIESALYSNNLRTKLDIKSGIRRHPIQMDHGFRKFFETTLRSVRDPPLTFEDIQILTGHSNKANIDNYYRPSLDANNILDGHLTKEYLRASDLLTIDPKNVKIEVLKREYTKEVSREIQALRNEIQKLKDRSIKSDLAYAVEKFRDDTKDQIRKKMEDLDRQSIKYNLVSRTFKLSWDNVLTYVDYDDDEREKLLYKEFLKWQNDPLEVISFGYPEKI